MLKHGAFSYLLKPLVTEELLSTLAEATRTIQEEESKRNILKSHKFNALQQNGYVHFTDELPSVLLNSHRLFACCTDFKSSPAKTDIADFSLTWRPASTPAAVSCWTTIYIWLPVWRTRNETG